MFMLSYSNIPVSIVPVTSNGSIVGSGIPLKPIFKFSPAIARTVSGDEGSGLGLAIARSIVELHGGRMWVESEVGKGASFHIALPNKEPHQMAAQSESAGEGNRGGNGVGGGEHE